MPPRSTRDVDQENTRELLAKAARKLFATKGFDATTVREIADEAGVNLSLISYHFNGKDGLYKHCIEEYIADKSRLFTRIFAAPPREAAEFKVKINLFIKERLSTRQKDNEIFMMVHRETLNVGSCLHKTHREAVQKNHDLFANFLRAGQKRKLLRSDVDPAILATFILGGILNISLSYLMKDEKSRDDDVDKAVDTITTILMKGLPTVET